MLDDELSQVRAFSRGRMRETWEKSNLDNAQLSDEERGMIEAMRLHPEYYDLWERLDEVTDEELERDGSNPILHIIIHQTVENQIAANDPPETAKTLERLLSQGKTRHEAVHEIGIVLAEEMFGIMKFNRSFDEQRYVRKLRKLIRSRKKRRRYRRRR
jgi:hypothetical protein